MAKNTWGPKNQWGVPPAIIGTRGDELPTTGKDGACILIEGNFVDPVAEASDLFRVELVSGTDSGILGLNSDSSFSWSRDTDGSSSFTVKRFKNDIDQGNIVVNVTIGTPPTGIPVDVRRYNSDLADYLRTQGYTGDTNSIVSQWLIDQGFATGSLNDRFDLYLRGLGFSQAYAGNRYMWSITP